MNAESHLSNPEEALRRCRQRVDAISQKPLPCISCDGFDAIAETITMPNNVILEDLQHAALNTRNLSWSSKYEQNMAMVLPADSKLVTVYVDSSETVYFYFNETPMNLYSSQFEWAVIGTELPADSIMYGIFFYSGDRTVLGLFDIRKESGIWVNDTILERHRRLHTLLCKAQMPDFVRHHWVGFARDCYACLKTHKLPFDSSGLLLLDIDAANNTYQRILAPIQVPNCQPAINTLAARHQQLRQA